LIEAKVAGKEIVAPPVHEHAQIINLMDALKQSVAQAKAAAGETAVARPPKKMAASTRGRGATSHARPWARIAAQQDRRAALIGRTEAF
jgi:hypothetical protein